MEHMQHAGTVTRSILICHKEKKKKIQGIHFRISSFSAGLAHRLCFLIPKKALPVAATVRKS